MQNYENLRTSQLAAQITAVTFVVTLWTFYLIIHIGTTALPSYKQCHFMITLLNRAPLGSGESHILLGGGGVSDRPPVISQATGSISKIKRRSIALYLHELSKHEVNLT